MLKEIDLIRAFKSLGVERGDTILVRAGLRAVGPVKGGLKVFISSLLKAVGDQGTIVSLSFTAGSSDKSKPIDLKNKSYAGALPNLMIVYEGAFRSRHPTCSYVAIGKNARSITTAHDAHSPAYEPIRNIIKLNGKCMLVGCVRNSPGFTTAHLAEADLGMPALAVLPWLRAVYYRDENGRIKVFRRRDPGLCSMSYYKFYSLYVTAGILKTGFVGGAYSILAPAGDCYNIEYKTLKKDRKFNLCSNKNCYMCNAGRWDRIHRAPVYLFHKILLRYFRKSL